jgi:hypothetical protein
METLQNGLQVFDSRAECQAWIDSRVIRFTYALSKVVMPGFQTAAAPVPDMWTHTFEKSGGLVLDPKAPDYVKSDMDEPVSKYAKPVRHADKWFAFMGKKKKK